MLINLFKTLKEVGVPCTLRELLDLISGLEKQVIFADINDFYYLSRSVLVKDEKHYDKFDRAFDIYFKGLETLEDVLQALVPEEWLRKEFEKFLTEDELKKIETMGGLEKLLSEFKKRLEEQKGKHQKGDKWVGTGGTSPFGNAGSHPEGIRVDGEGKQNKAVKVWQQRDFKNLDDSVELGTRNIKVALRRLRKFIRQSNDEELDLDDTIKSTAKNAGLLDIKMVPEKTNAVKVLVFFDVGGSMDPHIKICEELFSACKTEFKNLEYFYFHNFIYETVWKDNRRRHNERIKTEDVIHKYASDYKIIFVGDATMAPYEITNPGSSIEHWNEEAGSVWMKKIMTTYDKLIWLNPVPEEHWDYSSSIEISRHLIDDNMFPLTLKGLEDGMSFLSKNNLKALQIKNLTKIYDNNLVALDDISFEVEQGDFYALLGPNGAGKSTMIGIISSLVNKSSGKVNILGLDIDTHHSEAKKRIGIVGQEVNFNQFETVHNILLHQAGFFGMPFSEIKNNCEFYLKRLDLWDKRNEQGRNLSGGMKRRLMVAKALVNNPDLLILDEPTAGVDTELRRSLWEFLIEINKKGTTIILTTHYLEEAERLCKNISIIDRGKIVRNSDMNSFLREIEIETFVFDLKEKTSKNLSSENFDIKKIDDATFSVQANKGTNLNSIFDFFDQEGIEILSMRNETNRLEELFLKLTNNDH